MFTERLTLIGWNLSGTNFTRGASKRARGEQDFLQGGQTAVNIIYILYNIYHIIHII